MRNFRSQIEDLINFELMDSSPLETRRFKLRALHYNFSRRYFSFNLSGETDYLFILIKIWSGKPLTNTLRNICLRIEN